MKKVEEAKGTTITRENVGYYVTRYDVGGAKEALGKRGHNTCICALKAYQRYLNRE